MSTDTPQQPLGPVEAVLRANDLSDPGLRLGIAAALGDSGFHDRDRYEAFGWEVDPDEEEYVGLYLRNPYGGGLIDKAVQLAWRHDPDVVEPDSDADQTAFEDRVEKLARNLDFWTYLSRTAKAAGFGEYALLFINFDDTEDLDSLDGEVSLGDSATLDDIRGFRVVPQFAVDEVEHGDFNSGRWGEPEYYHIDWGEDIDDDLDDTARASRVHHSRVVEVPSKPPLTEEYQSRPRLERILNTLYDIEKLLGSAAEMSYRGADKGLHVNVDPTKVDPNSFDKDAQKSDIQEWYHGLQPTLNTVGTEVTDLGGDIRDPTGALEAELKSLSAATGFSKQFIEGAAAGEIASSETNMRKDFGEIRERQQQYHTPYLVRRGLDTLRDADVLPQPETGRYDIEWPDLFELSDQEEADLEKARSQTAKNLGLMGQPAQQYVADGEFPDDEQAAMPALDEADPDVQAQFEAAQQQPEDTDTQTDNAEDIDHTPPQAAQDNAQQVLDWREEHPDEIDGMTEVGWRRARQLADGGTLPADVITKMAQFNRHRDNAPVADEYEGEPWKDAGHVAWLGWGGDAGIDWAIRQSEKLTDNATRYTAGDEVSTPQGLGVVTAVATEPIDSDEIDEPIDASESSPTYMVVVEDARVGAEFYKAADLHSTTIETDVEPTESLAEEQSANSVVRAVLDTLTANDFSPPRSWRQSETPSRIIALKAFASMGGSFDGCVREMRGNIRSPDRFCGSFLDYVVGNPYWRGDSPLPGE